MAPPAAISRAAEARLEPRKELLAVAQGLTEITAASLRRARLPRVALQKYPEEPPETSEARKPLSSHHDFLGTRRS